MSSPVRTTLRQLWWAPLACYGLAWLLAQTGWVQVAEWRTLDWRTQFRLRFQAPPDPRLAVVLYEDATEQLLGQPWPVDRQYHAQMTQVLALAGARLVAWDVILDASREGEGDASFGRIAAAAAQEGIKVVSAAVTNPEPTGAVPGREGPTRPLRNVTGDPRRLVGDQHAFIPFPELRAASAYGFADAPPGPDGIRREIPLVVRIGEDVYPSLALAVLMEWFAVPPDKVEVRLGQEIVLPGAGRTVRVPIGADGRFLLNYRYDQLGAPGDLPLYSYGALLVGLSTVHLEKAAFDPPPPDLAGKMVWLGQTATGRADAGPTPLNAYAPLAFVHANVVANVLAEDYAWRVPGAFIWGAALLLGWLGLALLADRSVLLLCGGAVLGLAGYAAAAAAAWIWLSAWLPLVAPLAGFGGLQFIVIGRRVWLEQKAKREIKGMFSAYLAPQLVDRLVKSGERPQLGGHEEEITAYFSDIQGFSTFSEQLAPARLVELMNEYLTACTDIVQEEGGTLDKYIGDAVVAMFGAPIALPDHAYRACVASQRVQARLAALRDRWRAEGDRWPPIVADMQTRIGLNSGRCVVGNFGSRSRFNYTMMGDDVNLAARMESGAKSWGVYNLCTEATRRECQQHGGDRVVFRPLGRLVVKGRAQPVPFHEIVGLRESVAPATIDCVATFGRGLDRFLGQDWAGARSLFQRSAELEPNRPGRTPGVTANPSLVFLGLIDHYLAEPPPPGWDGVHVMKEK